ncbi:hypothetical protein [Rickettsia peacockii]|uniref:hypothetical protein n=1 Tax=Rickettsia peacockii TaxID=47589 RepID=UPI000A0F4E10|nr:hypothetical protein [Rickettsia peacockii]
MSLSDINTKLHQIESDICILNKMMHDLRVSIEHSHKSFKTYLSLVATQQIQLEKTLGIIVDNYKRKNALNKEQGLDDCFNNFNHQLIRISNNELI